MKTIIWTRNGCSFCQQAKELLESKKIAYEERNVDEGPWTREQLKEIKPEVNTYPQIFMDDRYVGGLNRLKIKFGEA